MLPGEVRKNQSGFTLIELLVTITIVAVLSGIGFTVFAQSQVITRDSRRKEDIKIYQTAFELFYEKHGYYPSYLQGNPPQMDSSPVKHATDWLNLFQYDYNPLTGNPEKNPAINTSDYIAQVPVDPINDGVTYHYNYYVSALGQAYLFCISLENHSDPDYANHACWVGPSQGHDFCVQSPTMAPLCP